MNEAESVLDALEAPVAQTQRFFHLGHVLDGEATRPEGQRHISNDSSLMHALEQLVIQGVLSVDDAAIAILGQGAFWRVYALRIQQRSIVVKALMREIFAPTLDDSVQEAHSDYRHGGVEALKREEEALTRMSGYLPTARLTVGEAPYLLVKHIEGCNLGNLLTAIRGRPDLQDLLAADITASLIEGQERSGHLQLDVKTTNIVVGVDGRATHVDWNLVKPMPAEGESLDLGVAIGTPHYMAPEQMNGKPNAKSPVFGLGCTLFQLWTGTCLMTEVLRESGVTGDGWAEIFTTVMSPTFAAIVERVLERAFAGDGMDVHVRKTIVRDMLNSDAAARPTLRQVHAMLWDEGENDMQPIGEMVKDILRPAEQLATPMPPASGEESGSTDMVECPEE